MEPIISPWLVYLASIVGALKCIFVLASFTTGVATFLFLVTWMNDDDDTDRDLHYAKRTGIALILCVFLTAFIPSEKTVWMMIGASYITPDNIIAVQDNLVDFAEQVAKAIK